MLGAPCNKDQGSFRTDVTVSLDASLLVFGAVLEDSDAFRSADCLALRLDGAPMTYPTIAIGRSPYRMKVKNAPITLPTGLVASATAIINAT